MKGPAMLRLNVNLLSDEFFQLRLPTSLPARNQTSSHERMTAIELRLSDIPAKLVGLFDDRGRFDFAYPYFILFIRVKITVGKEEFLAIRVVRNFRYFS